ncbi:putative TOS1-like glycosyl hydrolase-domain-containing protein [Paraphoma chrysanthemicola]|uniref:glucan endo-1,3-beta-D-glucosidase n=1 Tax=Paraphoma chrysanthemicola TaxID=798071 RepID=A0A8K0R6A7_9PLEO|nr:putative TOS1-like glycosyl hydrolase-domain-containing protein [Paraphoma chrysanthemicola]
MKHPLLFATLALPIAYSKTSGELCRGTGARAADGNWYCTEVWAITYRNISQTGAYNRTTSVDPSTGICGHERVDYPATGPLTPLFGEVSMHLRGPMNVSQLAAYQLPGEMHTLGKRNTVPFYNRRRAMNKRDTTEHSTQAPFKDSDQIKSPRKRTFNATTSCSTHTVTTTTVVTACDQEKTTSAARPAQNTTYVGPPLPCMSTPVPHASQTDLSSPNCTCRDTVALPTLTEHLPNPALTISPATTANKTNIARRAAPDWSRVAYYTSTAPAQATGFSFLANLGDPQKSGTFDYAFGNSLSYVTSDGGRVASESLPFSGTLDTSEREIAVFSDKSCDQDCPYWRPDATSHFGWSGSSKAFFIEFQMDHYQNRGVDQGLISDAPAWWFLNAAIPRVLQYGSDRNNIPCSCWSTGCGEFDAFEILGNGEERAKSTMHRQGNLQGGDSNYFRRPVGRKLKFAVVWHYPHITALVLDDGFDFSTALSDDRIQQLVSYDADSWTHSLFAIGD